MQRYFVPSTQFSNQELIITGDDAHHINRVMRMDLEDQIICCNDLGESFLCEITKLTNDDVHLLIVEWLKETKELPVNVIIASGLPKGDKLELIIQKATELGCNQFVPFNAARSIAKWDEKKGDKKLDRWVKIAKEAAEQSHRTRIPAIQKPCSFEELIKLSEKFDYKMVAFEEAAKAGEKSQFASLLHTMKPGQSILVVFGPEGGLTEKEIKQLNGQGFVTCGLGPRILRTETAPFYVLSAISYHFELQGVN
ncbi:16S rRNA (uracil(1498)-N(3))-methyltransferase [Bacillus sp. DJP31]|uniref:16S rRNA (uracil(1498)-N(3))-methyltransferase n=1 Tax=Bacillus sp. DJP31 TaxID=3409789 RepID=UPI003BB791EC